MKIIEKCKKKIEAILKKIDWEKVILNITLTAIIPILLFTAPVTTEKFCWDNWGGNIYEKLQQGVLFSTVISIASTIVLSYRLKFKGLFSRKSQDDDIEQQIKLLPFYSNLLIIIFSFMLMLLSAYYYGQIKNDAKLNGGGIILEIFLFLGIQLFYGYSEGVMSDGDSTNIKTAEQEAEKRKQRDEEKDLKDLEKYNEDFEVLRMREEQ